jgi:hypothetical protein
LRATGKKINTESDEEDMKNKYENSKISIDDSGNG